MATLSANQATAEIRLDTARNQNETLVKITLSNLNNVIPGLAAGITNSPREMPAPTKVPGGTGFLTPRLWLFEWAHVPKNEAVNIVSNTDGTYEATLTFKIPAFVMQKEAYSDEEKRKYRAFEIDQVFEDQLLHNISGFTTFDLYVRGAVTQDSLTITLIIHKLRLP